MLDRTIPPSYQSITLPHFPWPEHASLQTGVPMWILQAGQQPMVKLELIFDVGIHTTPQPAVPYCVANMLLEGTQRRSAQAIAQCVDQYGATLEVQVEPDMCSITLTTLTKYLEPLLALLAEVLLEPAFVEDRLAHLKHLKTQALRVEDEKSSYIAQKRFKQVLFAPSHPYGNSLTAEAVSAVTLAQLSAYYDQHFFADCQVLLSGQVNDAAIQAVQHHLQGLPLRMTDQSQELEIAIDAAQEHVSQPNRLQAAIYMGKVLFAKDNADYLPLWCVNTLLGGYFGSRLMNNLREDKGYTYGIYSKIITLRHASYLQIATEVIQASAQAACQEIEREIERLQTIPVPAEELRLLRNYLLGTFLSEINDPFSIMDKFKEAHWYGLDQTYYAKLYEAIVRLNADQVMTLAQQYLTTDSLSTVVVG